MGGDDLLFCRSAVIVSTFRYLNNVNFISIYRTRSFVIKFEMEDGDMFDEMKLFYREIVAFQDILPKVHELLSNNGDDTRLAPL